MVSSDFEIASVLRLVLLFFLTTTKSEQKYCPAAVLEDKISLEKCSCLFLWKKIVSCWLSQTFVTVVRKSLFYLLFRKSILLIFIKFIFVSFFLNCIIGFGSAMLIPPLEHMTRFDRFLLPATRQSPWDRVVKRFQINGFWRTLLVGGDPLNEFSESGKNPSRNP